VVDLLALAGEALGAVGHDALALGSTHGAAEVGLAREAELALAALGSVEGDNVVADLDVVDAGADRLDDTSALVAENHGEGTLRVLARKSVVVAAGQCLLLSGEDGGERALALGWCESGISGLCSNLVAGHSVQTSD